VARYLVTGAAGFIGSNLTEELVRRGAQVRALDNLSTGRLPNIAHLLPSIQFINGDIRDAATVAAAMQDVDYVLHQAALPSVPRSVSDPLASHECNATGTLNVLIAARDAGVKRVVYASSSSVYGDSPTLPKREDMPTDPLSPYAVNKLAGEQYCKAFTLVYGLPTVSLRYFNVFGPRQDPTSQYAAVIPAFATAMLAGRRPTIYGDGLQSRDFTYVSNVVAANLLACEREEAIGCALNIACGQRISLLDLVERLNKLLGTSLQPVFDPPRKGDVKHSLANPTQAAAKLGFSCTVDFDEGLARTVSALSK
jgi:UDP-N-acetylglucosamine/UDP-N-acetyl-alpha-D-glucosaminouronate 4-epimerase